VELSASGVGDLALLVRSGSVRTIADAVKGRQCGKVASYSLDRAITASEKAKLIEGRVEKLRVGRRAAIAQSAY